MFHISTSAGEERIVFPGMKQLAELISQAVDAQIWQDDGAVKLYLYCLSRASHNVFKWRGLSLQPGDIDSRESVLSRWFDAYGTDVLRLCCFYLGSRADAEDAAQETFLKAWKHMEHFQGRNQCTPKTWLMKIACNTCRDHLRRAFRKHEVPKEYLFGPGWQWGVDTEEDIWVLPMPDAFAAVHGTTGEVLDWRFTYPTQENWYVRYYHLLPEKMDHTAAIERAIQIVEEQAGDEREWTREMLYANAHYSYKEDWQVSEPEAGEYLTYPIPLWEVDLFYYVTGEDYARFVAGYMLDEDGNVLAERDPETRVFK